MQVLARSFIAVTIGIVFLIAMLFAFAIDLLADGRSRQKATPRRRNRPATAWS
jgi:hypothetical protein